MPFVTRKSLFTLGLLAAAAVLVIGGFVWSGIYNIGADDAHTKPVHAFLQAVRWRSINHHAKSIKVPDLSDPALIRQGAGNYDSMCTGCHLAPGMEDTELSKGLYPAPPALAKASVGDPAHQFWVVKHGIKASGMPAWGKSMQDEYIWGMVAFLQQLPKLDKAQYDALVASSGGHAHGGGESQPHDDGGAMPGDHGDMPMDESKPHDHPPGTPTHQDKAADPHADMDMGSSKAVDESKPHAHPPGTPADHHKTTAPARQPTPKPTPTPGTIENRHADGTVESHAAPHPTQADDGHDQEH